MSLDLEEANETQQLMHNDGEEEEQKIQSPTSPVTSNKVSSGAASLTSKNPPTFTSTGNNSINDSAKVSYVNEKKLHRDFTRSNNKPKNCPKETPDVKHMEKALLELLDDFHTGKLSAFGTGCSMEQMINIQDQQENLARLHFRLYGDAEKPSEDSFENTSNDKMVQLVQSLEQLSGSIELLQSDGVPNLSSSKEPLKFEKAKVAGEKQTRRRTRQIFDTQTELWEWTVTRRHPKEVKHWGIDQPPNPSVLAALNMLMDQTWLLTPPTKKRYLITLDMRHHMFKGRHFCKNYAVPKKNKKTTVKNTPGGGGDADTEKKESKKHLYAECFYNKHVTPGHVAIILALQLLKREKNAKLAVFTEDGVQLVSIERNFSNIEEAEFVLRDFPSLK